MAQDFWKNKKVLVTGATGFLGSALCKFLEENGAIVSVLHLDGERPLSISGIQFNGDVRESGVFERIFSAYLPDVVFHLAAQSLVRTAQIYPKIAIETNVLGTVSLLEACRPLNIKSIVIASTDKVYGRSGVPYLESHPLDGNEMIYEASKVCEDVLSHAYRTSYGMNLVVTRCGNIYGPGDDASRVIPNLIREFLLYPQTQIPPKVISSLEATRDFIYIDDIVQGYAKLAEKTYLGEVQDEYAFNFGGTPVQISDVVSEIQKQVDPSISYVVEDITQNEIQNQELDDSLASGILGWSPSTSLAEGIANTIQYHKNKLGV